MLSDVRKAAADARSYLLAQAEQQFAETCHVMVFPHEAGFSGKERQSSDLFARAVLASVLLDVAELETEDTFFKAAMGEIVRREADYVARAKLKDRAGGWSYFPDLPELPPDADSLSAALNLFARAAPCYLDLCAEPIALVLDGIREDGSFETWIISQRDAAADRVLMERGVSEYWGHGADIDVCASFYLALLIHDRHKYVRLAERGAEYVLSRQHSDGQWQSSWYWPQPYGIGLCLRLLREVGMEQTAISRAVSFLETSQRPDGGWGIWQTVPLDTALALWVFGIAGVNGSNRAIRLAIRSLLDYQAEGGYWNASPWIKMEVGRATGNVQRTATYQSVILTTAFCLRSLLLSMSWLRQ